MADSERKSRAARFLPEIGGDFSADWPAGLDCVPWPANVHWFARGRDALFAILRRSSCKRVHLPHYFCEEVCTSLSAAGFEICRYTAAVFGDESPDAYFRVGTGDAILVANYFGCQDKRSCTSHLRRNRQALVVEDHTHDPVSHWARHSEADYCFASLRKTLPVTDGAVAWSPRGLPVDDALPAPELYETGVVAMAAKFAYLHGRESDPMLKTKFRSLQLTYKAELESQPLGTGISRLSMSLVGSGCPHDWLTRRRKNVSELNRLLCDCGAVKLLTTGWPVGATPFACVIALPDPATRDHLRGSLIARRIYAPVHWPIESSTPVEAVALASTILTLPADHRYTEADTHRLSHAVCDVLSARY